MFDVQAHHTPDSKVHGAKWGSSGADRTQVGPMLAPWTLLSGTVVKSNARIVIWIKTIFVDVKSI